MTYTLQTLRAINEFKRSIYTLADYIVLQISNHIGHMITTNIDTRKIDCRICQAKDIRTATTRRLDLTQVDDNHIIDQLLHKFGHRRHTYVQLTS